MSALLDLVALRSLVEIAEVGSFTAAAHSLGLSQPAVSQHIRGLEGRFGAPLLQRNGRQTTFTAAGERVLAEARRLLAVHDDVLRALEGLEEPPLVVACIEHAVPHVLPAVLRAIEGFAPTRRVIVQVETAERIAQGLRTGEIDLAIVLGHAWDAPGDEVGMFRLRWVAAGRQDDHRVPLVVNRDPCRIRAKALSLLAEAGVASTIAVESSSLEGVLAATRAGLGVALLPMPLGRTRGLHERTDLPPAGRISVRLVSGRSVDDELRAIAVQGAAAAMRELSVTRPVVDA